MSKRNIVIGVGVVALAIAWYAFRPELAFIDKQVNEQFQASDRKTLATGSFKGLAHETTGRATIYRLNDGKQTLRLSDFETSNGPDVHVYLVAAADSPDNETVTKAGFVDLGSMKGNKGDQNYDIPPDLDLNKYRSVSIWCARFGVNFGSAPLAPASS
ncbi:MAG: DM13 domain-containing protein [Deltaproteobacteria bacterium]|nr:DM13 domain-containing protein [Deltaproteobacteria bacterium]